MDHLRLLVERNDWLMPGQLLAKEAVHLQVDQHSLVSQLALLKLPAAAIDRPGLGCGSARTAVGKQLYGGFLKDVI